MKNYYLIGKLKKLKKKMKKSKYEQDTVMKKWIREKKKQIKENKNLLIFKFDSEL